jgi:SAM-dependent methyltransferase
VSVSEAVSPRVSPCPACGGRLHPWRSVASSEPILDARRFELWRCERCGTAVTQGGSDAGLHETGAYRPGPPRLYTPTRPIFGLFDRQRLALLKSLVPPPASLLDAGAGRGRFVLAAAAAGYDASGVEPSARGAESAARAGARVRRTSIEGAELDLASLDVVTLWHVLEHLEDPGTALTAIRGWLRPGGGLLVGVPNLGSLQAGIGGERWYHLDVPRHRIHFTVGGLQALLERHGFEITAVRHALLEHNPFGMWQSWVSRLTHRPSYLYNLLKRNAPFDPHDLIMTGAMLPLAPVAALLEVGAALTGRGGTVAVLARRGA